MKSNCFKLFDDRKRFKIYKLICLVDFDHILFPGIYTFNSFSDMPGVL